MSEIRDPIYGFIFPSDIELKIINTKVFQRLRRVRQLGMEYLVYPSAHQTRFEHSLGVFHIAGLIADNLLPETTNKDKRDIIRLSALMHDLGHGPFSHVSEEVLNKYANISSSENKVHELITFRIIENDAELKNILSRDQVKNIIGLLSGDKVDYSLMKQIVSGPIDADKMDYLLRDSHCCGVKYGIFDLNRMLNCLAKINEAFDLHLGITYDGINMLEQYFLAKYYMTTQVYFHKIRRVADAMIVRGLELGIEKDNDPFITKAFCFQDTEQSLNEYKQNWDDRVIDQIVYSEKSSYAKDFFTRLVDRKLLKNIFSKNIKDIDFKKETVRDALININKPQNADHQTKLEKFIAANILKCQPEYVIVRVTKIKSVKEMARDSESSILVLRDFKPPVPFEDQSTIFHAINDKLQDIYVDIYAPLEFSNTREKIKTLQEYEKPIKEALDLYGSLT